MLRRRKHFLLSRGVLVTVHTGREVLFGRARQTVVCVRSRAVEFGCSFEARRPRRRPRDDGRRIVALLRGRQRRRCGGSRTARNWSKRRHAGLGIAQESRNSTTTTRRRSRRRLVLVRSIVEELDNLVAADFARRSDSRHQAALLADRTGAERGGQAEPWCAAAGGGTDCRFRFMSRVRGCSRW